jgi:allantoinase
VTCQALSGELLSPALPRYCRTAPSENTRKLLRELGGPALLYDSDAYNDEIPYWAPPATTAVRGSQQPHLVVPYRCAR